MGRQIAPPPVPAAVGGGRGVGVAADGLGCGACAVVGAGAAVGAGVAAGAGGDVSFPAGFAPCGATASDRTADPPAANGDGATVGNAPDPPDGPGAAADPQPYNARSLSTSGSLGKARQRHAH
jgi:hypothetical protein